ncbi:MAG: hypothetical protein ACKOFX_09705, partial [Solirubrobacterales bacterium]
MSTSNTNEIRTPKQRHPKGTILVFMFTALKGDLGVSRHRSFSFGREATFRIAVKDVDAEVIR